MEEKFNPFDDSVQESSHFTEEEPHESNFKETVENNMRFVKKRLDFMLKVMCTHGYSDPEMYKSLTPKEKEVMRQAFYHLNNGDKPLEPYFAVKEINNQLCLRRPYSLESLSGIYREYFGNSKDQQIPSDDYILEALWTGNHARYFKDLSQDYPPQTNNKTIVASPKTYFFDGNTVRIERYKGLSDFCNDHRIPRKIFNLPVIISNSIKSCKELFKDCFLFNSPVVFQGEVEDTSSMFENCHSFNQPVDIPNSVKTANRMFYGCYSFNQPVHMPDSLINGESMFEECYSFNQPILIPNNLENGYSMFTCCYSFNQPVVLPNSLKNCSYMFSGCKALNQVIIIPASIKKCSSMFSGCRDLNQSIIIPAGVKDCSSMFSCCISLEKKIDIPEGVENCDYIFSNCYKYTHDIYIPDSVKTIVCSWASGVKRVSVPKGLFVYSPWSVIVERN